MIYADLNPFLDRPDLIHALRLENKDEDVMMALVGDSVTGTLTLHFASLKLQKLFLKIQRDLPHEASGSGLARHLCVCMLLCQPKIERLLGLPAIGVIDSSTWPATVYSTRFPDRQPHKRLELVPGSRRGHLVVVASE